MKKIILLITAGLMGISSSALAANDVIGVWETVEGKSHVQISPCGSEKYCGEIIWLKKPNDKKGKPLKDVNNTDEKLRSRPILTMQLLRDLEKVSDNEWEDGYIYNPEDGQTYSSEMNLMDPDTLQVKGCVLFFCQSQTWKRIK